MISQEEFKSRKANQDTDFSQSFESDSTPDPPDKIESMDQLIEAAGTEGKRNYIVFFLLAWGGFLSPFISLSYQFIGATPEFWCQIPELEDANWTHSQIIEFSLPQEYKDRRLESCVMMDMNYTAAQDLGYELAMEERENLILNDTALWCQSRTFYPEEPATAVTKWDLVCERRALYSTTQAIVLMGKLIGSALMGYVMALLGRKTALSICIPLYLMVGVAMAFSPSAEVYITLKFIVSTVSMTFYLAGMVLAFELCSTSQRSMIGALFGIPFALGYMAMPILAYFVRPFTQLQIASILPALTALPGLWIIPESPRWLMLKGRYRKAVEVLQEIALHNGRKMPPQELMIQYMKKLKEEQEAKEREARFNYCSTFCNTFRLLLDKSWMWKIMILCFGWCSVSLVYYGVSLNPPNLSQDKYLYMFLGGVLEVPSYIFLWPSGKFLGRKKTLVFLYVLCALAIFGAAALTYNEHLDGMPATIHNWLLFLSLLGKFAITAAFQLIWIYTTELIPTEQRSGVVGICSMFARIGGIFSPYIVDLLGDLVKWAPSAIFGALSIVCGILVAFLPETKNEQLKDSS